MVLLMNTIRKITVTTHYISFEPNLTTWYVTQQFYSRIILPTVNRFDFSELSVSESGTVTPMGASDILQKPRNYKVIEAKMR